MVQMASEKTPTGNLPPSPHLADVGVLALVSDEWEIPWQSRHYILSRLAQYFNVVWCNPPMWWRKLWRHYVSRHAAVDYGRVGLPGLAIYRPERWLLEVGRPRFLAHWTAQQRLLRAQRLLKSRGASKTILYLWRPCYASALDLINHDLSCYHIDDEYTFSEIEKPLDESEAQLIRRADQVFIHSPALMEKKGHLNPHTVCVPNGVDYGAYRTAHPEPADLKAIPHPRIGYVGRIKPDLDFPLLCALAQQHRQWSFVLVGPQSSLGERQTLLRQLSNMPNVYLLGSKPVNALPAYTQHLDVCILCYEVNDYTNFIYPLKLHEYLASGHPVVGSPIRSLQDFAHIIRLARTVDEWSEALQESLSPAARAATAVAARLNVAQQHNWNKLVELIAQTLCCRLGPVYRERFGRISPIEHGVPSGG